MINRITRQLGAHVQEPRLKKNYQILEYYKENLKNRGPQGNLKKQGTSRILKKIHG